MDFKGTFDALKGKATDLAQAGVVQSKRLSEIAKLKMANVTEEDTIKKAYIEIGKLYYAEQGAAPGGAYAAACERITAARAAIEANKERIEELRQPGDPVDDVVETVEVEPETAPVPEESAQEEPAPQQDETQP